MTDMTVTDEEHVVLETFKAVEERDGGRIIGLYHPSVEFWWPPSLPYGGTVRGADLAKAGASTWQATWDPLQSTPAERAMDPRVVAARDGEVVVLYRQRGVNAHGQRFDGEVLGLYRVLDRRLVRAQMFCFDTVGLARFLAEATT
jgi:ketosteroid isomerase-like protein